jgi:hypothetical protein
MPYDVVYCWSEWRDGKWVEREHRERIASDDHRYTINVGGTRPPRMNWIRVESAGGPELGYSDGEDVGDKFARPSYRLELGQNIAAGRPYTLSRAPVRAYADTGNALLTNGYIGIASFWGLQDVDPSSAKRGKKAGKLVAFDTNEPITVTIDLGKVQRVGGARIFAVQPKDKVLFPATMTAQVSADGKTFREAGSADWEQCFFPPIDGLRWEGFDSPIYDDLPAGGILDHAFNVVFEQAPEARYVRFHLTPADGSAIALWELEVYDRIERVISDERIRLPAKR